MKNCLNNWECWEMAKCFKNVGTLWGFLAKLTGDALSKEIPGCRKSFTWKEKLLAGIANCSGWVLVLV